MESFLSFEYFRLLIFHLLFNLIFALCQGYAGIGRFLQLYSIIPFGFLPGFFPFLLELIRFIFHSGYLFNQVFVLLVFFQQIFTQAVQLACYCFQVSGQGLLGSGIVILQFFEISGSFDQLFSGFLNRFGFGIFVNLQSGQPVFNTFRACGSLNGFFMPHDLISYFM